MAEVMISNRKEIWKNFKNMVSKNGIKTILQDFIIENFNAKDSIKYNLDCKAVKIEDRKSYIFKLTKEIEADKSFNGVRYNNKSVEEFHFDRITGIFKYVNVTINNENIFECNPIYKDEIAINSENAYEAINYNLYKMFALINDVTVDDVFNYLKKNVFINKMKMTKDDFIEISTDDEKLLSGNIYDEAEPVSYNIYANNLFNKLKKEYEIDSPKIIFFRADEDSPELTNMFDQLKIMIVFKNCFVLGKTTTYFSEFNSLNHALLSYNAVTAKFVSEPNDIYKINENLASILTTIIIQIDNEVNKKNTSSEINKKSNTNKVNNKNNKPKEKIKEEVKENEDDDDYNTNDNTPTKVEEPEEEYDGNFPPQNSSEIESVTDVNINKPEITMTKKEVVPTTKTTVKINKSNKLPSAIELSEVKLPNQVETVKTVIKKDSGETVRFTSTKKP